MYEIVYNRTLEVKKDEDPRNLITWLDTQKRIRELNKTGAGVFARKVTGSPATEAVKGPGREPWTAPKGVTCYFVDAWTSGNPGMGGCRTVDAKGEILDEHNSSTPHTNNYFELKAISQGILYAAFVTPEDPCIIYSDSQCALSWIASGEHHATRDTQLITEMIEYIRDGLKRFPQIKVEKWDTSRFGEIPADYSRK
jgi:ribonuclease HI